MDALTDAELASALTDLPGWQLRTAAIARSFTFPAGFMAAIDFVNRMAIVAEDADHHPDIAISWNRVDVTLSTHSVGAVTNRDVALARTIDALARPHAASG